MEDEYVNIKLDLGKKIRLSRNKKKLTREEFCEDESELTVRQLMRIENGESLPTLPKLSFISKRLDIIISQLIDEKCLFLPSQYIIKKQDILKTLLHDDNTIKKIEDVFDEIHDLYYVDLPEEEQLAIEILQAIIDVHISNNPDFGEGLLEDYFFQVKLKETFSQNDLLLLQLYFNCIPFGEWDESEFNLLIKKTVEQVNYSLDDDLLLLNKVMIAAMGALVMKEKYNDLLKFINVSNTIMKKNKDFYRKPIVDMVEGKYWLHLGEISKAEKKYIDGWELASLYGELDISHQIKKEWQTDISNYNQVTGNI